MTVSPLTGSQDVILLQTIKSDKLIQDWQNQYQINISNELHGYEEIYLYQCNQTKLKFFAPFEVAGSGKLYEQLQRFDWFYMPYKWEHQVALKNLDGSKQILEVGCAFGSFLEVGIKYGFNIKGIELNEAAVNIAQQKNLPVERLDLEKFAKLHPQTLDAVCSFQVLEHIPNPKEFIECSIEVLKQNGKLIFCVPNSESFLKYQYNLLDMPPHHMLQWSESSFRALEKIFPIKLEKVIREPLAAYHVSSYLSSYSKHFCSINPVNKLFFNGYTLPIYEGLLNRGMRKFFTGQSLYVQFRKTKQII